MPSSSTRRVLPHQSYGGARRDWILCIQQGQEGMVETVPSQQGGTGRSGLYGDPAPGTTSLDPIFPMVSGPLFFLRNSKPKVRSMSDFASLLPYPSDPASLAGSGGLCGWERVSGLSIKQAQGRAEAVRRAPTVTLHFSCPTPTGLRAQICLDGSLLEPRACNRDRHTASTWENKHFG